MQKVGQKSRSICFGFNEHLLGASGGSLLQSRAFKKFLTKNLLAFIIILQNSSTFRTVEGMKVLLNISVKLLAESISEILKDEKEIELLTEWSEKEHNPDIILVDINSLNPSLKNKYPQAKLVLIDTGLKTDQILHAITSFNLAGLIATYTDIPLFKKALKVINEGQVWIDNALVKALMHESPNVLKKLPSNVSQREREIIQYVCQGLTNKEIAQRMKVSEQTIKTHLNRIFKKLGLSNRFQLVSLFLEAERQDLRRSE